MASTDGTVRLWDAIGGTAIYTLPDITDKAVKSVSFSPDGKRIVSVNRDGQLRIWPTIHIPGIDYQIRYVIRPHESLILTTSQSSHSNRLIANAGTHSTPT